MVSYKQFSALLGVSSILDLLGANVHRRYNKIIDGCTDETAFLVDRNALKSDWDIIEDDLVIAIKRAMIDE